MCFSRNVVPTVCTLDLLLAFLSYDVITPCRHLQQIGLTIKKLDSLIYVILYYRLKYLRLAWPTEILSQPGQIGHVYFLTRWVRRRPGGCTGLSVTASYCHIIIINKSMLRFKFVNNINSISNTRGLRGLALTRIPSKSLSHFRVNTEFLQSRQICNKRELS